jgi:hypothetical protein
VKDNRTPEQIVQWYAAVREAQRLRLEGVPDRTIARRLNDEGYVTERLKPWSGNAVKRLLIQEPPKKPAQPVSLKITPENPMVVELRRYRDGMSGGMQVQEPSVEITEEVVATSDEEWQAFKAAHEQARAEYEAAIRKRECRPRDWLTMGAAWSSFHDDMVQQMKYQFSPLALAGKDTWLRSIFPLVMRQVHDSGKVPMDLIDSIQGQPDVKGQLRRVFFGMMRLLAQEIETGMALRAEIAKLKGQGAAESEFETWKREHMVDLGDQESS